MSLMESPPKTTRYAPLLGDLTQRSGAMTALLISKEGTTIAEAGDTSYMNTTALAALVAGMFSATREVARMVGEDQFSILLQQGETRHIHISLISDSRMLIVIFEDYQRIGRVRHEARKAGEAILAASREEAAATPASAGQELGSPHFKEYALNLIDRIFVTKS